MPNRAKGEIMGHLVADPEMKRLPSGSKLCEFTVAVNKKSRKKDGTDYVSYFDCTCWGNSGEAFAEHHRKGDPVFLEVEFRQDRWENNDGVKRSKIRFTVLQFEFIKPYETPGEDRTRPGDMDYQGEDLGLPEVPF